MNSSGISKRKPFSETGRPRPTIGFLSANVHLGASRQLLPGVLDAATANDANLICFPGGRLKSGETSEDQRNFIYDLVNIQALDGLVSWASALTGALSPKEVEEFHRRYQPLPVVSLASPLSGSAMVSIDGYQGMRALIFHLVDVHRFRRIALIRGPGGHPYAQERYQAFLDALQENGLAPDAALISPPVSWENGGEALRVLLDERGLQPGEDFQAVVAASDLLAIGVLAVLAERGIRVPADVAVAGFNDIEEGRLARPPLTSVSLPFYEQGRRSVEALLGVLRYPTAPEAIVLESRLLVRQSCGCPSRSVDLAAVSLGPPAGGDLRAAMQRAQSQLFEYISQVISNRGLAATWAKQLMDAFRNEIHAPIAPPGAAPLGGGQFRSTLDSMLRQGVLDGDETAAWQNAISVLRGELLGSLDAAGRLRAENLFGQARVVIGEAIQRAQNARRLETERRTRILRDIGQALITTFDIEKLAAVLTERLEQLAIRSCYLVCFEKPALAVEEDPALRDARIVLAYVDGARRSLGPAGRRFPARRLIPADLLPERRYSLLVEPLYFQAETLGYVVFEVGFQDGNIYEVLRGHISSALKGAMLFHEAYQARLAAEHADQIKSWLLANVSHELRTPLNIIIGQTQRLLAQSPVAGAAPTGLEHDLAHIHSTAEHQLRIINDLLDLSRAEINALDLYPERLEPKALIEQAFADLARSAVLSEVAWRLELPEELPTIEADPVRLRQILLNLLSNAAKFTQQGEIVLGAEPAQPYLHVWVADTGIGVPPELSERIFEPFFTRERFEQPAGGIGLGLTITRRLVGLHKGFLDLESEPGRGATFHVYLPLRRQESPPALLAPAVKPCLWLITRRTEIPPEIIAFAQSQRLEVQPVDPQTDLEGVFSSGPPGGSPPGRPQVIAWDLSGLADADWLQLRRLQNHPFLNEVPFLLLQPAAVGRLAAGLTSLIVKPANLETLWQAIQPAAPSASTGAVLVIDDDPQARQAVVAAVCRGMPDYTVRTAEDGAAGLADMQADPPSLVVLDMMMPGLDGFEVLEQMRQDERTRSVPVVILSARQFSLGDIKRLEAHTGVVLQSKDILSDDELVAALNRSLFGSDRLPAQTSALVKRAVAYLHQNYARPLARWEIAEGIGVSEDYLSRLFKREIGISPWEYLNRYRVSQAKELLRRSPGSVAEIAARVGFADSAYFSRVFRQITGVSPSAFREK